MTDTDVTPNPPVRPAPVADWTSDYDIFDPGYIANPYPAWDEARASCPIAHSGRWGESWMPTRYHDVRAIAHDIEHFSSRQVAVVPMSEPGNASLGDAPIGLPRLPPIQADPPVHTWSRRLLLPSFSHRAVAEYEPTTRALCDELIDAFVDRGHADAATEYAQQIPVRVISLVLGIPSDLADRFTGWVRDLLEFAHDADRRSRAAVALAAYLRELIAERRRCPGTDLISELLQSEGDGEPVSDDDVVGIASLTLIAGVDTTWSAIGSALWHLATHEHDRHRLSSEPELMATAVEELLRAYSPVTMARIVAEDVGFMGCPMKRGDRVLLNFPSANRDPDVFDDPDRVILDRAINRHLAFGAGIHRCAGSNLARMELRVAISAWLARIPEFRLADPSAVTWAGGQVRGPRTVPVVFP